jgi:hypothetical protein
LADRQRTAFLNGHEHLPLDQCFRVLDVAGFETLNNKDRDNTVD